MKGSKTIALQIPRLSSPGYGIHSYVVSFLKALEEVCPDSWEVVATATGFAGHREHEHSLRQIGSSTKVKHRWFGWPQTMLHRLIDTYNVPDASTVYGKFDILHNVAGLLHIPPTKRPVTCVCHDVLVLNDELEESTSDERRIFRQHFEKTFDRYSLMFCISAFTKSELLRYFDVDERKLVVVLNGVDRNVFHPATEVDQQQGKSILAKYGLQKRFVLTSGGRPKRKNLVRLVQAYTIAREKGLELDLVLCGGGTPAGALKDAIIASPYRDDIKALGYIPAEDLPAIVREAYIFVFPSFYEGFGLPPLEAMASGVPLAVSRAASLPEVAGDAAIYFDPFQPDDIAAAMLSLHQDDALRSACIERGAAQAARLSWQSHAAQIVGHWQSLL